MKHAQGEMAATELRAPPPTPGRQEENSKVWFTRVSNVYLQIIPDSVK